MLFAELQHELGVVAELQHEHKFNVVTVRCSAMVGLWQLAVVLVHFE